MLLKVKHVSSTVFVYLLTHMEWLRLSMIHTPFTGWSSSESFSDLSELRREMKLFIYCELFLSHTWLLQKWLRVRQRCHQSCLIYLSVIRIFTKVSSSLVNMSLWRYLEIHRRFNIEHGSFVVIVLMVYGFPSSKISIINNECHYIYLMD